MVLKSVKEVITAISGLRFDYIPDKCAVGL